VRTPAGATVLGVPSPAGSVLTQRALNRALLARQCLLEPSEAGVPQTLERMAGLQAQYAPSMYIGLWSRMARLGRAEVTRGLENRSIIQGTLLRSTIHLVSAPDYWPFALAVREARRTWYLRASRDAPAEAELENAAGRARSVLCDRPLRRAELAALLGPGVLPGLGLWLDLVRVPPFGTWDRRRADLYAAAEDWVGPPTTTAKEGQELLVRRYLAGFGPAARADVADWSGLPLAVVDCVLAGLPLRRFRAEDGTELVDLPDTPLPDPDTPAPVRFLPTWDATLLVHARRTQILPERHRARIFNTRTPQSFPTFLVDGQVAGTWKLERGRLRIEEFEQLHPADRRAVDRAAEPLAAFLA
jgi:hypothetical protein